MKRTFEQWKRLVDDAIEAKTGLTSDGIRDWEYSGAYQDGMSPSRAAAAAVRAAREF